MAKVSAHSEHCSNTASKKSPTPHPDHSSTQPRVNRIQGQLNAVSRMIDERRYCPQILQQIRAARAALVGLEKEILREHLRGCVRTAFESRNPFEANDKIEEIIELLD